MVVLHVKRDEVQFLFRSVCSAHLNDVRAAIVQLHNLVRRVDRLSSVGEVLNQAAGVITASKSDESGTQKAASKQQVESNLATALERLTILLSNLAKLVNKDLTGEGIFLQSDTVEAAITEIAEAVPAVFPHGVPSSLDGWMADLDGTYDASTEGIKGDVVASEAVLWFAGRQLDMTSTIAQAIGRHENTRAAIILMRKSEGRPVKEKAITPEQEDDMLDYAYRKEQIWRELEAADADTHHLNSRWADPYQMKRALNGLSAVRLA